MIRFLLLLCILTSPSLPAAELAWLRDGKLNHVVLEGKTSTQTPLGSLWKLFVYAYLVDNATQEPTYVCRGKTKQEAYCCEAGGSIERDAALVRSCGLYFEPSRLKLEAQRWREFWGDKPAWLRDLKQLQPDTQVDVLALLQALDSLSPAAKAQARTALLGVALDGYGHEVWTQLGTGMRYKTYSWHDQQGADVGGVAGWLVDGTPFWFAAAGSSRQALRDWANKLHANLPVPRWQSALESACVDVAFFARYPIRAVMQGNKPAADGRLYGEYEIQFANQQRLVIRSQGELLLQAGKIHARLGLNDYLARVIEREGGTQSAAAAQALAVVARSYVLQNASFSGGCWQISDSSRSQRVSPNPPGTAALAAAWFSDELVLLGVPVNYHLDAPGENRLAWQQALQQAQAGWDFARILQHSYPRASFASLSGRRECRRLNAAEDWLARMLPRWRVKLQDEAGYEALTTIPQVCALNEGHPYADAQRTRLYVRGWRSLDERVTLAHEYLHLAFRYHPNGSNEQYIEQLARRLLEGI